MAKHPPWLETVGVLLGACALTASAVTAARISAYLPVVGPAPLQFQASPAARPFSLPPLLTQSNPVTNNTAADSARSAVPYSPPSPSTNPPASPLNAQATFPEPWPSLEAPPEFWPVMPQTDPTAGLLIDSRAVLGYLLPVSTNRYRVKALVPAFVPPPAPVIPSSQAIYESR